MYQRSAISRRVCPLPGSRPSSSATPHVSDAYPDATTAVMRETSRAVPYPDVTAASIFDGARRPPTLHPLFQTFSDGLLGDTPRAHLVRAAIDEWVLHDTDAVRAKFRGELLSRSGEQCQAGFCELLVRETLRHLFGQVETEPALPCRGLPDFAATVDGRPVAFEVATITETPSPTERRRTAILRRLGRIRASWLLDIDWDGSIGLDRCSLKEIEREVRAALVIANRAGVRGPGQIRRPVNDGWLVATLLPLEGETSILGFDTARTGIVSPCVIEVRKVVAAKARKYRELKDRQVPLVVVLCPAHPLMDQSSVFTAMYGDEVVSLMPDRRARADGRLNRSGLVTPNHAAIARHTTVSAAWLAEPSFSEDAVKSRVTCFPNPWARNPIDWPRLPLIISTVELRALADRLELLPPEQAPAIDLFRLSR